MKLRRKFTSLGYIAMRFYRSVMRTKPPTFIIQLFVITLSIFLLGGGIYNILKNPFIAIPLQGRWFFYYPYTIHEQSYIESLITMILLAIGATGFLLTYQSTRYIYKPRQGVALLTIGFALIFIAYYALEQGIRLKLTAPY